MHDDQVAGREKTPIGDEAGALAREIADVQRAAGQLRMAEAVLDQVAIHLVEMESYFAPSLTTGGDNAWRRKGIESAIRQIRAVCEMARVNGRKLFGGIGAIEAHAAGMVVSLELPGMNADVLGDARDGTITTLVDLPPAGCAIISAAQAQVTTQKARVGECAAKIGEMIQTLQIALEMHAAVSTTLRDDEFARAVAQTSQADVFMASQNPAPAAASTRPMLRIRRQPR